MLNPLLHTSNSAPTSPVCTRSIHSNNGGNVGVGGTVGQPHQFQFSISARHHVQTILASAVRQARARPHLRSRDSSPVAHRQGELRVQVQQQAPQAPQQVTPQQRRLSRLVKCRTLDFTEFPEGMREYGQQHHQQQQQRMMMMLNHQHQVRLAPVGGKLVVRESQSQPGSPGSVPRIRIQDFGGGGAAATVYLGSEVLQLG